MPINELWYEGSEADWRAALANYYNAPFDRDLEDRMEQLQPEDVERMNAQEFYSFLYDEYFVWKYTSKNRLATTRKSLSKYMNEGLESLNRIKAGIFRSYEFDPDDTEELLEKAQRIHGLGIAGASGLLSILFPEHYGTLDQFLVIALRQVDNLPEHDRLVRMTPEELMLRDGVLLENILRRKATELNVQFNTNEWTPRKLDMILWAIDRY